MRDFIDRLATRALGSESMLSPRLPSLFEPQRTQPAGLLEEVSEIVAPAPQPVMAIERPAATLRETPVHAAGTTVQAVTTAAPTTAPVRPMVSRREVGTEPTLARPVARPRIPQLDQARLPPSPQTHAIQEGAIAPALVQRERLVDVLSAMEGRKTADEGTLLPPAQSVFRTPPAPTSTSGARFPPGHPTPGMPPSETHEPVVHVSIGRLEVRATPAPGKAAHRQDAPRSSALDDYLRQRNKASP